MALSKDYQYISREEYLEGEKNSQIKHEYIDGQAYAMAGASKAHIVIGGNVFVLLRNHLRGNRCFPYSSDMKVYIESKNVYYYPDLVVSCDERDREDDYVLYYPKLIVEVLSKTTEAFDRGNKFADYDKLETLEEYVLISQDRMRVESFRRNAEGQWVLHRFEEGDEIKLTSVNFSCSVSAIYEDVVLEAIQQT